MSGEIWTVDLLVVTSCKDGHTIAVPIKPVTVQAGDSLELRWPEETVTAG